MYPKVVFSVVVTVVVGNLGVVAEHITVSDEQYSRFPRLFQLDDYEGCLARPGGLYCVGTFSLKPTRDPDPVYELMKEYSKDTHNFNHTLLHRGYCVTSRCPRQHGDNAQRFEQCAARWGRRHGYRLLLQEVRYCRTHEQDVAEKTKSMDTPQLIFLLVVFSLLLMNIIGTLHDVSSEDGRKSSLLTAWSVRSNWPHLVGPFTDADPRLATVLPVEAFRVLMLLLVMFAHVGIVHDMMYLQNPRLVELESHKPRMMLLQNGNSAIQMFVLLSSFLLAHQLLHVTQQPPSLSTLPMLLMKRIIRISPVYLVVLGFAATWWPVSSYGPLWWYSVREESEICSRKLWAHALFMHNVVDSNSHCLPQTWFVAVEMQLYAVACVLTLCLLRARWLALPVLGAGFLVSCVFNGVMAYVHEWKPLFLLSVPEHLRVMFRDAPAFRDYYNRPTGSLPAMFMGLFVAHLHYEVNRRGFKPADHKWLIISCQLMIPVIPCWTGSGYLLRDMTSPLWQALYVALERPVVVLLSAALLFGAYNSVDNKKSFLQHMFCWRVWYPLGRASLAALMVHWCVAKMVTAGSLTPITTSAMDMTVDFIATAWFTYMISVPLTLLLEIPMRRFYSALVA